MANSTPITMWITQIPAELDILDKEFPYLLDDIQTLKCCYVPSINATCALNCSPAVVTHLSLFLPIPSILFLLLSNNQ